MNTSKTVFTALVGSYNYNLNTKESDKDYKSFLAPNFDDLYLKDYIKSKSLLKVLKNDIESDIEYHDIRKLEGLFYKSNINFLEVLFSEDFEINKYYEKEVFELLALRKDIAKMNLPYLYKACIGMYHTKKKLLKKGTEGTQYLVDKYGYDTKQALHCYRVLNFLKRFQNTGFNDFKSAIWYKDDEPIKEFSLKIKNGEIPLEEMEAMLDRRFQSVEIFCKKTYMEREFNEITNQKVINIIKKIVKKSIKKEFSDDIDFYCC
jgi:predicted nucleotidyltransferase